MLMCSRNEFNWLFPNLTTEVVSAGILGEAGGGSWETEEPGRCATLTLKVTHNWELQL